MIIGISGVSCAGKSTLAGKLAEVLNCKVISLDDYYVNHSINWEVPASIAFNRLIATLKSFKGKTVVVEGFLLFVNSELLELLDKKFYLDISINDMVARRKNRSDRFSGDNYITDILIPYSEKYRYTQLTKADVILDGRSTIAENLSIIMRYL